MPIKDLVDRHRHGHDRLVLGRPLTKEGPGSFLVPPTVVHTAAEQDRDAARTRNPGYAATTRRAVVPARRPSSPAARSHRCAPTQRPPSGAIMITPTFRPKSGADRWSVTSLAGRMVAIVNLGRWVSRLDGRERLEDLVGVHSVPGNDPAVAWLQ
jgi:hypothetical protein